MMIFKVVIPGVERIFTKDSGFLHSERNKEGSI